MQNESFKFKIKNRTYQYSIQVINLLFMLSRYMVTEIIAKQLLKSATSMGANIFEAQASSSKRDFANFITHSLKSANESLHWLQLLKDTGKSKDGKIDLLLQETQELANILGSSVLTLTGKR